MDFYETQNYSTVEEGAGGDKAATGLESGGKALQAEIEAIKESIPWSAFSSFVGNVRKYGEDLSQNALRELEEAKKDFKSIGETLHRDLVKVTASAPVEDATREASSAGSEAADLASTTERLGTWFKSTNLDKYAADIGRFIKEAVVIEDAEDDARGGVLFDQSSARRQQVFLNRMERQLSELQNDVARIAAFTPPAEDAPDGKAYAEFVSDFSADDNTAEIAEQLERYPELRKTMEELVPEKLEYKEFWLRYYWLVAKLKIEEERRKRLMDRAALDEEAPGWDDDEEDEETAKTSKADIPEVTLSAATSTDTLRTQRPSSTAGSAKAAERPATATTNTSPRASSDSSYDLISQQQSPAHAMSEATQTPPAAEDDSEKRLATPKASSSSPAPTKSGTEKAAAAEESDDDWE